MGTFVPSGKNIDRKWFVMDASGQTLGRLATKAASVLAGKLNPQYVPYIDVGDFVIVINAEKVRLTGLKSQQKLYRRYTGFPGGLREESFTLPSDKRLTVSSYAAGVETVAYVEPVAVGDCLPEMPVFLTADRYVPCPLEATYQTAWEQFPAPLKKPLEEKT